MKTRPNQTYQAIVAAPGFTLGVLCDEDEITGIDFLEPRPEIAASTPLAAEAVRQLRAYLADPSFAFGLPLKPAGKVGGKSEIALNELILKQDSLLTICASSLLKEGGGVVDGNYGSSITSRQRRSCLRGAYPFA